MTERKKICVVTGTRAEYGLLYWVMKKIQEDSELELQLIVTCMHLSKEFGETYKVIEADGFQISKKIEMLLSSDTKVATSKSMGLGLISFADAFEELKPDFVLLLGDRFETLVAAQAAFTQGYSIGHIHGGEVTFGAVDEGFRHAITKMSHYHFVSTPMYAHRVKQLGENPDHVFIIGAPGLDNLLYLNFDHKEKFEKRIGLSLNHQKLFLITYHPETIGNHSIEVFFNHLLKALDSFKDVKFLFTKANADAGGRLINEMIDNYVSKHPQQAVAHTSLGPEGYMSALKFSDIVIGNSSSGIIEAPYFKKPVINIGKRQDGRAMPRSVISTGYETIVESIHLGLSYEWQQEHLQRDENIYGIPGNISKKIVKTIKSLPFSTEKKFFDIKGLS